MALALEIFREIGTRNKEASSLNNLGSAYGSLGQHQQAIEYFQQSLEIAWDISDRKGEASSFNGLGIAYKSLGEYQRAIEFHQQFLGIAREIGDQRGEAIAWLNLGLSLENLKQKSEAIDAYRNARQLYEAMGLDADVQDCDEAIERLSKGFWSWLSRLLR